MRSDVPATPGSDEDAAAIAARADRREPETAPPVPPVVDDWDLDELLRQVARLLATEGEDPASRKRSRLDAAHQASPCPSRSGLPAGLQRLGQRIEAVHARRVLPLVAWVATLLGTMSLVCGGVLLVWSTITGRQELWRIGTPVALGGGAALAAELLLQLDRLRQRKRTAASPVRKEPPRGSAIRGLAVDPAHPALAGQSGADSAPPAEPKSSHAPSRPAEAGDLG